MTQTRKYNNALVRNSSWPFPNFFLNYLRVRDVPMFLRIPGSESPTFVEKNLPLLSHFLGCVCDTANFPMNCNFHLNTAMTHLSVLDQNCRRTF